jgi:prophage regulatory protein
MATTPLHKIIRLEELPAYTGLQTTQIKQQVSKGTFPKPVRLSERRFGWLEADIVKWQQERITEQARIDWVEQERAGKFPFKKSAR